MKETIAASEIHSFGNALYFQSRDAVRNEIATYAGKDIAFVNSQVRVCIAGHGMMMFTNLKLLPDKKSFNAVIASALSSWTALESGGKNRIYDEIWREHAAKCAPPAQPAPAQLTLGL